MSTRWNRLLAAAIPLAVLAATGCSSAVDPAATAADDAADTSATQPSSTSSSSSPSTTQAAAALRSVPFAPTRDWDLALGVPTTACGNQQQTGSAFVRKDDPTSNVIFDATTGDWLTIPLPQEPASNETISQEYCAIAGDQDDPLVVYSGVIETQASGVQGISTRTDFYAYKIRDGAAAERIELTQLLSPDVEVLGLGGYPGGVWVREVGGLNDHGLRLINFDSASTPSTVELVAFPSELSFGDPKTTPQLLTHDSDNLDFRDLNLFALPSGERLPTAGEASRSMNGPFLYFQKEASGQRPSTMHIRDTRNGTVVETPLPDFSNTTYSEAWEDIIKFGNNYVVDMASGKVLLNTIGQIDQPQNFLAGKYLYVVDDQSSPVIDLETMETVSEGWDVRPLLRLNGWTLVSKSSAGSPKSPADSCGGADIVCELVPDNAAGEYPGPWW